MAINPSSSYPGQTDATDPAYPLGKAQNISAPSAGDGTPWEQLIINDLFGFQQALLDAASITASGAPDEVGASQYLTALQTLFEPVFAKNTAFNKDFGTLAGTVCEGDDARLPTTNQKAAMTNANAPTGANPFATINDVSGSQSYGGVKVEGNASATVLAIATNWYQFANFNTNMPNAGGITSDQANDQVQVTDLANYEISADISLICGTPGDSISVGLSDDGGSSFLSIQTRASETGDPELLFAISEIVTLAATSNLTLWFRNNSNPNSVTGRDVRLKAKQL